MEGRKHSLVTIQKMKDAQSGSHHHNFGKILSNFTRDKMKAAHIGHTVSTKTRDSIRIAKLGTNLSLETRLKISNTLRGHSYPEERNRKISRSHAVGIAEGRIVPRGYGFRGWYISSKTGEWNFWHSTFELKRMKFFDSSLDIRDWTKNHGLTIGYKINGLERLYVPDFLIVYKDRTVVLEEIKGYVSLEKQKEFDEKNAAAFAYCDERCWNFRVVWKEGLNV